MAAAEHLVGRSTVQRLSGGLHARGCLETRWREAGRPDTRRVLEENEHHPHHDPRWQPLRALGVQLASACVCEGGAMGTRRCHTRPFVGLTGGWWP
jgi:hypothetical protein